MEHNKARLLLPENSLIFLKYEENNIFSSNISSGFYHEYN